MKFALLLLGSTLCGAAPLATAAPKTTLEVSTKALLPPQFTAGDLTVMPIQAGFDYARRVFPGDASIDLTPIFSCTFQVSSATSENIDPSIGSRIILRRILGPQGEYVHSFNGTAIPVQDQPDRFGFYNAQVDPRWEYVDLDLDILTAQQPRASGKMSVENLAIPVAGKSIAINRDFVGDLGTQFRLVKIERQKSGQMVAVVHHQKPADAPADLELSNYNLGFKNVFAKDSNDSESGNSGGSVGGLSHGGEANGNEELTFSLGKTKDLIKRLDIEIFERAPSRQDRSKVVRQRLRYPLQKLLSSHPIAPLQPGELRDVPTFAGRAQNESAALTVETDGFNYDDVESLKIWMQAKPDDAKRGIRWNVAGGTATFSPGNKTSELNSVSPPPYSFYHSDLTRMEVGETGELVSIAVPEELLPKDSARAKATHYDLKIALEGHTVLPENYERTIELPADTALVQTADDEEQSLILRKIQRFSSPEELTDYPDWVRGSWPNAGVALVFEANPLLVGGAFEARAFDAEDDAGRTLKLGTFINNVIYNIDLTQANSNLGDSKFYTLVVSQPAKDVKSFKVWLGTLEKSSNPTKMMLEIQKVPLKTRR